MQTSTTRRARGPPFIRPPLNLRGLQDDDSSPNRDALKQIDDVGIRQAKAARRYCGPDGPGLIGAVDAIDRAANVQRAGTHRVARSAEIGRASCRERVDMCEGDVVVRETEALTR